MCLGLLEIRDEGFFHRDVKLANVFITNKTTDEAKMKFKIGDFGLVAKTREENRVKIYFNDFSMSEWVCEF